MEIILTKDQLPNDNEYVLAHYSGGNWHDSRDQYGCEWVVVKFVSGLSLRDRGLLLGIERSTVYRFEDEGFNNKKPYAWISFGPSKFFGQDIDKWTRLPGRG